MSALGEAHVSAGPAEKAVPATVERTPFWRRQAVYRYGFVALILIVWEIVGPMINPIFFTYPSQIARAFYELTVSGELPYYMLQSLEVLLYGLGIAIVVGI